MSKNEVLLIAFAILAIIIIIALIPWTKTCKLNVNFNLHDGFKVSLTTNEKNTPSHR